MHRRPLLAEPTAIGCPILVRRFGRRLNHMALNSFLSVLFLAVSDAAQAATINAASPSFNHVAAAISLASDGDTLIIPAGTASWTAGLVITKGITLKGKTTTDPVAKTADDQTIIV